MKRVFLTIIAITTFVGSLAQADELERVIYSSSNDLSITTRRSLGANVPFDTHAIVNTSIDSWVSGIKKVQQVYDNDKSSIFYISSDIMGATSAALGVATFFFPAIAPVTLPYISTSLSFSSMYSDYVGDTYKKSTDTNIALLSTMLQEKSDDDITAMIQIMYSEMDSISKEEALSKYFDAINAKIIESVEPENQHVIRSMRNQALTEALAELAVRVGGQTNANAKDLRKLSAQIADDNIKLQKQYDFLKDSDDEIKESITNLELKLTTELIAQKEINEMIANTLDLTAQSFNDIATSLGKFSKRLADQSLNIDVIKDHVEFISQFTYGKASSTERVVLLKKLIENQEQKYHAATSKKEKSKIMDKIVDLEIKLDLNNDLAKVDVIMDKINGYGEQYLTIANNFAALGLLGNTPQKVSRFLSKGLFISNGVGSIVSSYMSGNMLGAFTSFSSVLSGVFSKGLSASAARHQQIMQQLNQIQINQQIILENLQKIAIFLQEAHQKEMERLNQIYSGVISTAQLLEKTIYAPISKDCNDLFPLDDKNIVWNSRKPFSTVSGYSSLVDYFTATRLTYLTNCMKGIDNLLGNSDYRRASLWLNPASMELDDDFFEDAGAAKAQSLIRYVQKEFIPTKKYYDYELFSRPNNEQAMQILLNPIRTVNEHHTKNLQAHNLASHKKEHLGKLYQDDMNRPVNTPRIIDIAKYLTQALPITQVAYEKPNQGYDYIIPLEQLIDHKSRVNPTPYFRIKNMLYLALADDILMSGTPVLGTIYRALGDEPYNYNAKQLEEAKQQNCAIRRNSKVRAICVLDSNPTLRYNFMLYALSVNLEERGISYTSYDLATRYRKDAYQLTTAVFNNKWQFQYMTKDESGQQNGWFIKIGNNLLPIPTAETLLRGEFIFHNNIDQLITQIANIENILIDLQMQEVLTPQEKEAIFDKLI